MGVSALMASSEVFTSILTITPMFWQHTKCMAKAVGKSTHLSNLLFFKEKRRVSPSGKSLVTLFPS